MIGKIPCEVSSDKATSKVVVKNSLEFVSRFHVRCTHKCYQLPQLYVLEFLPIRKAKAVRNFSQHLFPIDIPRSARGGLSRYKFAGTRVRNGHRIIDTRALAAQKWLIFLWTHLELHLMNLGSLKLQTIQN